MLEYVNYYNYCYHYYHFSYNWVTVKCKRVMDIYRFYQLSSAEYIGFQLIKNDISCKVYCSVLYCIVLFLRKKKGCLLNHTLAACYLHASFSVQRRLCCLTTVEFKWLSQSKLISSHHTSNAGARRVLLTLASRGLAVLRKHHRLGDFNNRNLFPHEFWSLSFKIKAELVSSEASLLGL